jgi:hypothetical protein
MLAAAPAPAWHHAPSQCIVQIVYVLCLGLGVRFFGSVRFLSFYRNSVLQKLEPK